MMTHGKEDGKVFASDEEFLVQHLWEPFLGNSCNGLIGKPKLFFIQASRGGMMDSGICFNPKPNHNRAYDMIDSKSNHKKKKNDKRSFMIPSNADFLVMFSSAEGYISFRNPSSGSWFIQTLCKELEENIREDLLTILTGVIRSVAFTRHSFVPDNSELDDMKQIPTIMSMLTKTVHFIPKKSKNPVHT